MLNNKDYCDYDTCVALEELGFPLHPYGNTEIDTSLRLILLLYEAQKWLREEKKVNIVVCPYTYVVETDTYTWTYEIWFGDNFESEVNAIDSYEEALSEGIKEAVKILMEENNGNSL